MDFRTFQCPHCHRIGTVHPGTAEGKGWCGNVMVDLPIEATVSRRKAVTNGLVATAAVLSAMNDGRQLVLGLASRRRDSTVTPPAATMTAQGHAPAVVVSAIGIAKGTATVRGILTDAGSSA